MAIPKEHQAKKVQRQVMAEKANESPSIFAQVGDGGGTVATGRANFYYIRLRGDENRVTQCYSLVPLADGDLIYVRQAQDRKLRWYEFVEFIQTAGGGTGPPVALHDVLGAYHGDAATAAIAQGDVVIGDATPEINRLAIGNAHEIFKVNAGGTDPNWEPFDWDEMATPGGADMVHDHSAAIEGGQDLRQIQEFELDDAALLTIDAAGTITRTQVYHVVAANAGVADNLDQIDGGVEGDILIILPDAGDTITVRHNAGGGGDNIWLAGGADIALNNDDHLMLIYDGTWWCDVSGGAGLADHTHSAAGDGGDDLRPETVSSQGYLVGPGCVHTTLGAAVVAVNAAGPPASGTEYTIKIMAGTTTEAGDVTIPSYCTVEGAGENTVVDMGGWTLYMSDDSSLLDLVILGTDTATLDINGADCLLRNVRVVNDGSGSYVVYIYGDSDCKLYDVVVETGGGINYGILVAGTATPLLVDCTVDDATNFTLAAIGLSNSANVVTIRQGKYRGSGDDIWTGVSSTLYHFDVDFRPVNSTFGGTHVAQPTKRFNQWVIVAKQGGDFQLPSEAITWINTLGDAAVGKRYGIFVAAGNYTEVAAQTVPSYVGVFGQGWATRWDMGSDELTLGISSSLESLHITSSTTNATVYLYSRCAGQVIRDCYIYNTSTGEALQAHQIDGTAYVYGTVLDGGAAGVYITGVTYTSTLILNDCQISADTDGINVAVAQGVAYTEFCTIVGTTNDVNLAAGAWTYLQDGFDPDNCTITGTATPHNGQHVVYFPCTRTVGAAGDFATVQAGVDWFKNRLLCAACKLDLLDSSYAESVVVQDVFCAAEGRLEIEGDTRGMAGATWVDSAVITCQDANAGSGVCALANAGANITVTGAGGNPDFDADGWTSGTVIVRDNAGAITTYTISTALNNVITLTVAAPAVGNTGTSITLVPNVTIVPGGAGHAVEVIESRGILLDGLYLDATAGATGYGLSVTDGGGCKCENVLAEADENGFEATYGSLVKAEDGACTAIDCGNQGFNASYGGIVVARHGVAVGCTNYGFQATQMALVSAAYAVAAGNNYGFRSAFFSDVYADYAYALDNTTYGFAMQYQAGGRAANSRTAATSGVTDYYASYNSYMLATNTNVGGPSYSPAVSDTEGNVYAIITFS